MLNCLENIKNTTTSTQSSRCRRTPVAPLQILFVKVVALSNWGTGIIVHTLKKGPAG
jgi:hypothetical protein